MKNLIKWTNFTRPKRLSFLREERFWTNSYRFCWTSSKFSMTGGGRILEQNRTCRVFPAHGLLLLGTPTSVPVSLLFRNRASAYVFCADIILPALLRVLLTCTSTWQVSGNIWKFRDCLVAVKVAKICKIRLIQKINHLMLLFRLWQGRGPTNNMPRKGKNLGRFTISIKPKLIPSPLLRVLWFL